MEAEKQYRNEVSSTINQPKQRQKYTLNDNRSSFISQMKLVIGIPKTDIKQFFAFPIQRMMTRSLFNSLVEDIERRISGYERTSAKIWQTITLIEGIDNWDRNCLYDTVCAKIHGAMSGDDVSELFELGSDIDHVDIGENEEYPQGTEAFNRIIETGQLKRSGNKKSDAKSFTTSTHGYYDSVVYKTDSLGNIAFGKPLSKKKWADPINYNSQVDLSEGVKGTDYGKMLSGNLVKIRGASRKQHFSIANRIKQTGAGDNSPDGWTWHHLTSYPKMILVDREVHLKFGHNGGVFIW